MARFFLRNPGFELGDQDWTKFGPSVIEKDAVNARSGLWVGRAGAISGGNAGFASGLFGVRPGLKISASGWSKHTADFNDQTYMIIQWFEKSQSTILVTDSGNQVAAGTTVYTQSSIADAVAPDRAKFVRVRPFFDVATVGDAWFDDIDASGDIIEDIPATAIMSSYRVVPADTIGVFDPLVGQDKFTEFNSGMSDKWAGVYTFTRAPLGGNLNELLAFLRRVGNSERFFAFDPDRKIPINGVVNGMLVDGAVTGGATKIPVKSGPVSSTALVAGDYMEIKDQYFQLQRDLEIGPEGTGEAIVWPSARSTLADGEDVITDNPKIVARITSDLEWLRKAGDLTSPTISWEEV